MKKNCHIKWVILEFQKYFSILTFFLYLEPKIDVRLKMYYKGDKIQIGLLHTPLVASSLLQRQGETEISCEIRTQCLKIVHEIINQVTNFKIINFFTPTLNKWKFFGQFTINQTTSYLIKGNQNRWRTSLFSDFVHQASLFSPLGAPMQHIIPSTFKTS